MVVVRCCWDARDDEDAGLDMLVVRCCWGTLDDAEEGLDLVDGVGTGGGGAKA